MWWPNQAHKNNLLTISFNSHTLSMALIRQKPHKHFIAFEQIDVTEQCSNQGIFFNSTFIVDTIQRFCLQHKLNNPYAAIGLDSELITETITTNALPDQYGPMHTRFAYTPLDAQTLYAYGLSPLQQMQYQLIALRAPFYCLTITSMTHALHELVRSNQNQKIKTSSNLMEYRELLAYRVDQLELQNLIPAAASIAQKCEDASQALAPLIGLYTIGKRIHATL